MWLELRAANSVLGKLFNLGLLGRVNPSAVLIICSLRLKTMVGCGQRRALIDLRGVRVTGVEVHSYLKLRSCPALCLKRPSLLVALYW